MHQSAAASISWFRLFLDFPISLPLFCKPSFSQWDCLAISHQEHPGLSCKQSSTKGQKCANLSCCFCLQKLDQILIFWWISLGSVMVTEIFTLLQPHPCCCCCRAVQWSHVYLVPSSQQQHKPSSSTSSACAWSCATQLQSARSSAGLADHAQWWTRSLVRIAFHWQAGYLILITSNARAMCMAKICIYLHIHELYNKDKQRCVNCEVLMRSWYTREQLYW